MRCRRRRGGSDAWKRVTWEFRRVGIEIGMGIGIGGDLEKGEDKVETRMMGQVVMRMVGDDLPERMLVGEK
jgi:hypothetical protein